ncbi:MAG: LLM class flavin-dependent oxidoreductase, partial [Thermocrispum sp.]
VQRPRPPIWIAGVWPRKPPMRRAARWDGLAPMFVDAEHGHLPPVDQVRDVVAYVEQHREERREPYDVIIGGKSDPVSAADLLGPLREAGATWWDERQLLPSPELYQLGPVMQRIEAGPPRL